MRWIILSILLFCSCLQAQDQSDFFTDEYLAYANKQASRSKLGLTMELAKQKTAHSLYCAAPALKTLGFFLTETLPLAGHLLPSGHKSLHNNDESPITTEENVDTSNYFGGAINLIEDMIFDATDLALYSKLERKPLKLTRYAYDSTNKIIQNEFLNPNKNCFKSMTKLIITGIILYHHSRIKPDKITEDRYKEFSFGEDEDNSKSSSSVITW